MKLEHALDTIVALATAEGEGSIAVIRISGEHSFDTMKKLFYHKKKQFENLKPNIMTFCKIRNPTTNEIIDEVMVCKFQSPYSFTGEDVVEIYCHGNMIIVNLIISVLIDSGVRLAEPGEFTKRAFLNERIDLIQAEAINDLIRSRTLNHHRSSLSKLQRQFSNKLDNIRSQLVGLMSLIEVNIDYPEEEIERAEKQTILSGLTKIKEIFNGMVIENENVREFQKGVKVVIAGKTNAGKSSLFNRIVGEERALVSSTPGTTRDYIETIFLLDKHQVAMVDTAGLRKTDDEIEILGKEKTLLSLEDADIIIFVIDSSEKLTDDDLRFEGIISGQNTIIARNKTDLDIKTNREKIYNVFKTDAIVDVSAKTGFGINELRLRLIKELNSMTSTKSSQLMMLNKRELRLIKDCVENIEFAIENTKNDSSLEFVALDIREVIRSLSEITGEITTEEVLDNIFQNFCIGK